MRLSKNFTLAELTHSATARRYGIDNEPSEVQVERLRALAETVLQPLRTAWGDRIIVTSGFRSPRLNRAIGGAINSQHLRGEAADISTFMDTREDNEALFQLALRLVREGKIVVGQLIDEEDYNWIHISLPGRKTNEVLHLQ